MEGLPGEAEAGLSWSRRSGRSLVGGGRGRAVKGSAGHRAEGVPVRTNPSQAGSVSAVRVFKGKEGGRTLPLSTHPAPDPAALVPKEQGAVEATLSLLTNLFIFVQGAEGTTKLRGLLTTSPKVSSLDLLNH